jgi:hypothetical protein
MLRFICNYISLAYGVGGSLAYYQANQWLTVGYGLNPMIAGAFILFAILAPGLLSIATRNMSRTNRRGYRVRYEGE